MLKDIINNLIEIVDKDISKIDDFSGAEEYFQHGGCYFLYLCVAMIIEDLKKCGISTLPLNLYCNDNHCVINYGDEFRDSDGDKKNDVLSGKYHLARPEDYFAFEEGMVNPINLSVSSVCISYKNKYLSNMKIKKIGG